MIYLLLLIPFLLCVVLSLVFGFFDAIEIISNWAVPTLVVSIPLYGIIKGVRVYEVFVEGAKEGFEIAVKIMPYLVAILVAIGMLRDVGLMTMLGNWANAFMSGMGISPETFPMAEILPMAIIRPLSGSGALGVMNSIFLEYGPDSYIGMMASVMMGSTETTFYILAVYFGAVNISNTRHAVLAGLAGDFAGAIMAITLSVLLFS